MSQEKYIGMDVHQATISVAVLDSRGKLIMESILETKAATILEFVQGLHGSLSVTFEEGTSAAWLHDLPMYDLGRLFVNGDGIEKDIAEGYFWLFLSASAYSLKSTKVERARMNEEYRALQHIATSLTEQERERIEDSCREWLNAHKLTKCFNPKL